MSFSKFSILCWLILSFCSAFIALIKNIFIFTILFFIDNFIVWKQILLISIVIESIKWEIIEVFFELELVFFDNISSVNAFSTIIHFVELITSLEESVEFFETIISFFLNICAELILLLFRFFLHVTKLLFDFFFAFG